MSFGEGDISDARFRIFLFSILKGFSESISLASLKPEDGGGRIEGHTQIIYINQKRGKHMAYSLTWTPLRFGKYEGKTLPQIVLTDPNYFFWGFDRRIFRDPQDSEASTIAQRARQIKPPKTHPEDSLVEYYFSPNFRFLDFSIIDPTSAISASSNSEISTSLDLSLPRELKIKHDRFIGYDLMLEKLRHYYFGGSSPTKTKCEDFFYRSQNFVWRTEKK